MGLSGVVAQSRVALPVGAGLRSIAGLACWGRQIGYNSFVAPATIWCSRKSKHFFNQGYPMESLQSAGSALEEIADFLASGPSPDELLQFRPSPQLQARAQDLLEKRKDGFLSTEELRELDQFEHAERLVRLTKARIHARKARP
jgi:hypothetical protein